MKPWRRHVPAIARRDGWGCHWCGIPLYLNGGPADKLTVDHLKPRSVGGTHELSNLVFACPHCNGSRVEGVTATRKDFPRA